MIEGEENVILEAQSGSEAAFAKLYDHYIQAIYRFIFMKVMHREEAEDLTHEVFVKAWVNLPRYQARGFPFSSWLYQIARNRVIDHYRLAKNHLPIEAVDAEVTVEDESDLTIDRNLNLEEVRAVLKYLTHDQQDVILMKFMEDLPHREIAEALGKSEGAVRLIQHRAIRELRRRLSVQEA
jgi:RNA polymerase sigma-70 factor (ECF subfamily)